MELLTVYLVSGGKVAFHKIEDYVFTDSKVLISHPEGNIIIPRERVDMIVEGEH